MPTHSPRRRSSSNPPTLGVHTDHPGADISAHMYGVFFEDINYGADGGLHGELIQNRSFEFPEQGGLFAWQLVQLDGGAGRVSVETADPIHPNNGHYARLHIETPGRGVGLSNAGFGGIVISKGKDYRFHIHARQNGTYAGGLIVKLESPEGKTLAQTRLTGFTDRWTRTSVTLTATGSTTHARLIVLAEAAGVIDLDMISLFPKDTWKQREFGMRADMVQILADMKPGFVRFPGGCIVEGKTLENRYQWKLSIGDPAHRGHNWNRWADWKSPPVYHQSYGVGFHDYFLLCEDIGAQPLPILNCGMACQFQTAQLVPLDQLDPYIQDALDLIEYANGPVTSTWGAQRAAAGHPEPFNLMYLGIGNEQWDRCYFERYVKFHDAIKAKYPDIVLVTSAGPGPDDKWYHLAMEWLKTQPADLVDEHYYRSPMWFLRNDKRYDNYDRQGVKVFAGEYAAHRHDKKNSLDAALAEAAFLTGMERNAEVVRLASYAPLFAKVGATQWRPDLIWCDNTRVYGSPSYHVQKLFSLHRGDQVIPVTAPELQVEEPLHGAAGAGTWQTLAEFKNITVKAGAKALAKDAVKDLKNWHHRRGDWSTDGKVLRQMAYGDNHRAILGDGRWKDYSLRLQARKLDGQEGVMVYVRFRDELNYLCWNLGGWGNAASAIQCTQGGDTRELGARVPFHMVPGRWYDLRVDIKGDKIRCFLDGKLMHEAVIPPRHKLIYATAAWDKASREWIVKVVNTGPAPQKLEIQLQGVEALGPWGTETVLTADSPDAENMLDAPDRVAPKTRKLKTGKPTFTHEFPGCALTVLRLPASGK